MRSSGKPGLVLAFRAILAICCLSCGRGGPAATERGADPEGPPASVGSCTGPVPAHADACPGADSNLTTDVPRSLQPSCVGAVPCSYSCSAGHALTGGACEPVTPPVAIVLLDDGDGTFTVQDERGQRVWTKMADCGGPMSWSDAASWAAALADGACGLRDGSVPGDWTMPSLADLFALWAGLASTSSAGGNPAAGVSPLGYWSSFCEGHAGYGVVDVTTGNSGDFPGDSAFDVWPVRAPRVASAR